MQSYGQTIMISIAGFKALFTCSGSGASPALPLFARVTVEGRWELERDSPGAAQ